MKALFISNDPHIFVPESAVRARMRAYAASIGELHVLSVAPKGSAESQEGTLYLHPLTGPKLLQLLLLKRRAKALIVAHGIDVVSAQDPFEYGRAAVAAAEGTRAAVHLQVHTDFLSPHFSAESFKNRMRIRIADQVLLKAHGIRAVSERVKKSMMERYGNRIVEPSVIPIGIASGLPLPAPLPEHAFTYTMIAIGRLETEKRIDDMLQVLARIRIHYQNTGLFIFGDGRCRSAIMRRAGELGLLRNVVFLGHRHDARRYIEHVHSFIQTSAYEGYGATYLEVALARKPIVTTDVGIIGEVFDPKTDVLACAVGDIDCLTRQVSRLIEDNPLRKLLADAAEIAAKKHLETVGDVPSRIAADLMEATQRRMTP